MKNKIVQFFLVISFSIAPIFANDVHSAMVKNYLIKKNAEKNTNTGIDWKSWCTKKTAIVVGIVTLSVIILWIGTENNELDVERMNRNYSRNEMEDLLNTKPPAEKRNFNIFNGN